MAKRNIEDTLTGSPEDGAMVDVTPKQVGGGTRPAPPSDGSPFAHYDVRLVSVSYVGRKNERGTVSRRTPKGEHIDVIVPDAGENEDAVADYASGVNFANVPEDKQFETGLHLLTPEHVHLFGRHYHFEQGRVNHKVHPDDVPFLLAHGVYKFEHIPDGA